MPMNLTNSSRLDGYEGSSEILSNGECIGVEYLDGSPGCGYWLLQRPVVRITLLVGNDTCWTSDVLLLDIFRCFGARENK